MRNPVVTGVISLVLLSGCGETVNCTLIGGSSGLTVSVDKAFAPKVASGTLRICRERACEEFPLDLRRAMVGGGGGLFQNGRKVQRVESPDMEPEPTTILLTLRSRVGKVVLNESREVTPSLEYPNGPDCGPRVVSAIVRVDASGKVTAQSASDAARVAG